MEGKFGHHFCVLDGSEEGEGFGAEGLVQGVLDPRYYERWWACEGLLLVYVVGCRQLGVVDLDRR